MFANPAFTPRNTVEPPDNSLGGSGLHYEEPVAPGAMATPGLAGLNYSTVTQPGEGSPPSAEYYATVGSASAAPREARQPLGNEYSEFKDFRADGERRGTGGGGSSDTTDVYFAPLTTPNVGYSALDSQTAVTYQSLVSGRPAGPDASYEEPVPNLENDTYAQPNAPDQSLYSTPTAPPAPQAGGGYQQLRRGQDDPVYSAPGGHYDDVRQLLARFADITAANRITLHEDRSLGKGTFGQVLRASLALPGGKTLPVAAKMLRDETTANRLQFLQEAAIQAQFHHPNIVRVLGVVVESPAMILLEIMDGGELKEVLLARTWSVEEKVQAAVDVAMGMR